MIVAVFALAASALIPSPAVRAESVGSDSAHMAQLQRAIADKGAEIGAFVVKVKPARAKLVALHVEITHDEQLLATDARVARASQTSARPAAVFPMAEHHSLDSVKSYLDDSVKTLEVARARSEHDRRRLVTHQRDAQEALDRLARAQADAKAAITAANTTLARVSAELTARLVDRKHHREAQALRVSQHAFAAALARATENAAASPARRTVRTSQRASLTRRRAGRPKHTAYANPLRGLHGLLPERIDQGVDFAGEGPVYAIGNGVVLNVYASGWPNGTFIAYQLTDGPAKGLVVFTAEDLTPQVAVGSTVTANTVIGQMFRGPHGIEIGWADGSAIPNTMARTYAQYYGGNSTAFGDNFSRLLQSVGGPGGVLKSEPAGALPPGWPQW